MFVLLYGCGSILIREARVRWKLQWSVVLLAIAYAIVEEGLLTQTFFNPQMDLGVLTGYGMYLGVNWVYAIAIIIYHAIFSTLIPIAIIDLCWPECSSKQLLKRRGLALALMAIIAVTSSGIVLNYVSASEGAKAAYIPNAILLGGGAIAAIALIWLSYAFRNSRISTGSYPLPPFAFFIIGFLYMPINLLTSSTIAGADVHAGTIIIVQILFALSLALFGASQLFNKGTEKRHIASFITGSVLLFILLAPLHEMGLLGNPFPTTGMLAVGIISLILLVIWRRRALKKS